MPYPPDRPVLPSLTRVFESILRGTNLAQSHAEMRRFVQLLAMLGSAKLLFDLLLSVVGADIETAEGGF